MLQPVYILFGLLRQTFWSIDHLGSLCDTTNEVKIALVFGKWEVSYGKLNRVKTLELLSILNLIKGTALKIGIIL